MGRSGADLARPRFCGKMCVPAEIMELAMDDRKRNFGESLAYRIAARRFNSAFDACQQLSEDDQQLLLKEIAQRISQTLPKAPAAEQSAPKVLGIKITQS